MEDAKLALFLRAESLRMENDFDEAIPLYERILEIDPRDMGAHKVLAELYLIYGDRAKGVNSYYQLAQEHRRLGELDKAASYLRKIRVLDTAGSLEVTAEAIRQLEEIEGSEGAAEGREEEGGRRGRDRGEEEEGDRPEIALKAPLFGALPAEELKKLLKSLRTVRARKGTIVFREGDLTRSLFIIGEGVVEIRARATFPSGPMGDDRPVAVLRPGEFFGEFSFLTGAPRSATARVVSEEDAVLYVLSREAMEALTEDDSVLMRELDRYYRDRALDLIFARSALFAGLPADDRKSIAARFELRTFPAGSLVIEEGRSGDDFFLVKSGEVEIARQRPDGKRVMLALLGPNQFFGEISFLMGKPRSASAIATSEAQILVIDGAALQEVVELYPSVKAQLEKARLRRAVETARRLSGRPRS